MILINVCYEVKDLLLSVINVLFILILVFCVVLFLLIKFIFRVGEGLNGVIFRLFKGDLLFVLKF